MLLNIITITKDDFEGLKKTVESTKFLRINYDCVVQIIVDSSNEVIRKKNEEYLSGQEKVIYVWQNPSGRSSAFNYGLRYANSKWVWFLNGGDEVHSDLNYDCFLNILSQNNSDAIIFQLEHIQSNLIPKHPELWSLWPPLLSWIPHPATITRRYLYDEFGNFDESLRIAMDFELWVRFFSKKVVVDFISIPIARFDQTGDSYKLIRITKKEVRKVIMKYLFQIIKRNLESFIIIIKALVKTR